MVVKLPLNALAAETFLEDQCRFRVDRFGDGVVAVEPLEGAGQHVDYFHAIKLCDADTDLADDLSWRPLREFPRREDADAERRARLRDEGTRILHLSDALPTQLDAISALVSSLTNAEVIPFLRKQMAWVFSGSPEASLWLVGVDDRLLARLAFLRIALASELTPDIPLSESEFPGARLLSSHSFTQGVDFGSLFDPTLLAFSPGAFGCAFAWPPHALVLLFGYPQDLRVGEDAERPLRALYAPAIHHHPQRASNTAFSDGLALSDFERLLPWWAKRMSVLYSHAADPTQWLDRWGRHTPTPQTAWLLTVERMLADGILLLSQLEGPALLRMQTAFDLLDKAEALLGYRRIRSGKGFKALLDRGRTLPRLREAWETLPSAELNARFADHSEWCFESVYAGVRAEALAHRLTPRGIRIAGSTPDTLRPIADPDYVGRLVRAVRNSSHGLIEQLEESDRLLLATHSGKLPWELGDLAANVMLGLCGQPDRLIERTWLTPPQATA